MKKNKYQTKYLIPQLKIALLLASTFLIIWIQSLEISLVIFGIISFIAWQVNPDKFKNRIKFLAVLFILILLGRILFLLNLTLEERIVQSLILSSRMFSITLVMLIFTSKVSLKEILNALHFLPNILKQMITITFSFLPAIEKEVENIYSAQKARGYSFSYLKFYKSVFPLLVPLIHRNLKKAEQIAMVMESRGWK
jgi:energy-coupling factor transporter transmembrane protein EcfT